jgi:MFS family permease
MPSQLRASRWAQLLLGLVVMMAVSSPQYVWTLFVKPFQAATGAGLPTVQITFSVLIVVQTLFSPAQGWLVDRFGPKALVAVGAALAGIGWILSAHIDNIWMLFLTYGLLCGVGNRHRLRRRHRPDGQVVSGSARIRDRYRGRRLRNGRYADDIPHRLIRRADDPDGLWRHSR